MQRDDALLLDILLAAQQAQRFSNGLREEEFKQSELHQFAVAKALELIGEAAARMSADTRAAHPEIPWHEMIGMRNRLIHEYFRIDLGRVWATVQYDIPLLIDQIQTLVPPPE